MNPSLVLPLVLTTVVSTHIQAADSSPLASRAGFQLSLTPEIALHDTETEIRGVSLGIWSRNPQQSLTLGIVNGSTGESSGVSWALGLNYAESYAGVHWALINVSTVKFNGWQNGIVNYSRGELSGLQSGVVNFGQKVRGLQCGTVNYAETLRGVQVGLVNVAGNNSWFRDFPGQLAVVFPFLNWSF